MTLSELKAAIDLLLEDPEKADEPVVVGTSWYLTGISVVVSSDVWMEGTIVASVEEIEEA